MRPGIFIRTKEIREKISKALKGRKHSEEAKRKMRESHKDRYGERAPHYGKPHSLKSKQKMSKSLTGQFKGEKNPMYGKQSPHSKKSQYKNIWMRSTWEVIYAKWLDLKGYTWSYEPKRFYFDKFTYLPDFYVEELKSYVEVKGYYRRKEEKDRIEEFSKNYPLILIQEKEIEDYKKELEATTFEV